MTVREWSVVDTRVLSASFLARLGKKGAPKVYGRVEEVKEICEHRTRGCTGVYADACNAAEPLPHAYVLNVHTTYGGPANKYNA